jgi:hypothetical protein
VNDFKHLDEAMETQLIPDCGTGTYDYFWVYLVDDLMIRVISHESATLLKI